MQAGTKVEIGFFDEFARVNLVMQAKTLKISRHKNKNKASFLLDDSDIFNLSEFIEEYKYQFKEKNVLDYIESYESIAYVKSSSEKFDFNENKQESVYIVKKVGSGYVLTIEATDEEDSGLFDEFNKDRTARAKARAEARKMKARHKEILAEVSEQELCAL